MEGDLGWCCRGGNNWDLHAVVRFGSGGGGGLVAPSPPSEDSFSWLPQPQDELINAAAWQPIPADPAVDDLCQAFLAAPKPEMPKPPSPRNAPLPQRSPADEPPPAKPRTSGRGGGGPTRSKRKSKKSLVTKEVTRVQAEAPSPDLWAWRKYGQKPIKGSPYPRGYYRCSTDKDCKARKQVERCRADPATLMVTYTGDHSHPVPLHRNSLAGTTRNKSQPPPSTSSAEEPPQPQALPSSASNSTKQPPQAGSPSASAGLSPATSLRSSSAEYEDAEEDDDTLAVRLLREDTAMAAGGDDDAFLFPKPDELGLGPVNGGGGCEDAMLFPNPDEPALGPVNGGGCEDAMLFPNSDEPAPGPGNGRGGCEDVMLFPKPDEPAPATTMISNRTDGGAGAAPVMDIVEDKFSVSGLPA